MTTDTAASEATQKKAAKYLAERRVNVVTSTQSHALIEVTGSGDVPYNVVYNGGWTCDCPARLRCAHIEAASLIVHRSESTPTIPTTSDEELDALLGL